MFPYTGISIVVLSFFIIYNNIRLPNDLKGFLFFIQVTGTELADIAMHFMFSNDSLHMKNTSLIITLTVACYIRSYGVQILCSYTYYQNFYNISSIYANKYIKLWCMWLYILCLFQLLYLYSNCLGYRICL